MHIGNFKGCDLEITVDDIAIVQSDALITAVNSKGEWVGGVDAAIRSDSGRQFHAQLRERMPLYDGRTILADRRAGRGMFDKVLFVVDDWMRPLSEIVTLGLISAEECGMESVTIPALRCGSAVGKVVSDVRAPFVEQMTGMRTFMNAPSRRNVRRITMVIHPDSEIYRNLSAKLRFD